MRKRTRCDVRLEIFFSPLQDSANNISSNLPWQVCSSLSFVLIKRNVVRIRCSEATLYIPDGARKMLRTERKGICFTADDIVLHVFFKQVLVEDCRRNRG